LDGSDISSNAYDFANRLIKSRRDHTAVVSGGSKSYTTREEYVYDHASRLRFTRHKINSANWVVTSAPVYDEMGRLLDKRLHASNYDGVSAVTTASTFNYLQSLDYTYNIRNWLSGINDPTTCTLQSGDQLQDVFRMQLNYETSVNGSTAQYNGNISSMQWNTHLNGTCSQRQLYMFSYDAGNRLTAAAHRNWNGTAWTDPNQYNESGITYDLNGNLKTYTRRGLTAPSTFGDIDILSYTYGDAQRPDRLTKITDTGDANKGFKHNPPATGNHYAYDGVGNMTTDNHKKITIAYNYLNLPSVITYTDGTNRKIEWTYDANGTKLTKVTSTSGVVNTTKNYVSGIEYAGVNLDAIYFSEGRLTPNGASFYYEYTVKDHLGNARISFRANGTAISILQENHYYPFGLEMEGSWQAQVGTENAYQYNSKELNEDFGLNWYDYGARWYDAAVGRWWSVDPLGEKYKKWSSYNYTADNPLIFTDPSGMEIVFAFKGNKKEREEDRKMLESLFNEGLEGAATVSISKKTGKVSLSGFDSSKGNESSKAFYEVVSKVNTPGFTVNIKVENGSDEFAVGVTKDENGNVLESGSIDIADISAYNKVKNRSGAPAAVKSAGKLAHELEENYQVQAKGEQDWNAAHQKAVNSEDSVNGSTRGSDSELSINNQLGIMTYSTNYQVGSTPVVVRVTKVFNDSGYKGTTIEQQKRK
jgi:RHS repeat-associated protein